MSTVLKTALRALVGMVILGLTQSYNSGLRQHIVIKTGEEFTVHPTPPPSSPTNGTLCAAPQAPGSDEEEEGLDAHMQALRLEDINEVGEDGLTPLMRAARAGNEEGVRSLIARGADVNLRDEDGQAALHLAAWRGHTAIVELLLANQAKINLRNKLGDTALSLAIQESHREVVKLLLDNKANTSNLQDKLVLRDIALHRAMIKGDTQAVNRLLFNDPTDITLQDILQDILGGSVQHTLPTPPPSSPTSGTLGAVSQTPSDDDGVGFEVEFEGERGRMIEHAVAPTGMQCGFFGMGTDRAGAYAAIRSNTNEQARRAVIQTLVLEYGAGNRRTALDGYLLQTLGFTIGENDFEELLVQDQELYQAILKYFFERDQAQLTFHPGMMGLLDGLAIIRNQRVIVWQRDAARNIQRLHDTRDFIGDRPNIVHLIYENGHFNFLEFQTSHIELVDNGTLSAASQVPGSDEKEEEEERLDAHMQVLRLEDINEVGEDGLTPLMRAARAGNEEGVRSLIARGADVNLRDRGRRTALHWAAQGGHEGVVCLLVNTLGVDVNIPDKDSATAGYYAAIEGYTTIKDLLIINEAEEDGLTPLVRAVLEQDIEEIRSLLARGANVNILARNSGAPLHAAVMVGNESIVRLLLDNGAEVNLLARNRNTPLQFAAINNHAAIARLLLDRGATINLRGQYGNTALHLAAGYGAQAIVEMLLDRGADVNLPNDRGYSVLYFAVLNNRGVVVAYLLRREVNINRRNELRVMAMNWATQAGHMDLAQELNAQVQASGLKNIHERLFQAAQYGDEAAVRSLLLDPGVDVNQRSTGGATALHIAAKNGCEAVVRLLVGLRANINLPDNEGAAALHLAAYLGNEAIVHFLVEAGADVNLRNRGRRTALYLATQEGHEALVHFLVEAGADVNLQDENGDTALHWAVQQGRVVLVRFLVESGAKVRGTTVLHLAAEKGHEAIVRFLVESGARVNLKDSDGRTALHLAAQQGHEVVVRLLAGLRPDVVNLPDNEGITALHLAAYLGHEAVVRVLVEVGANVNSRDRDGRTALDLAVANHRAPVARFLRTLRFRG